MREGDLDGGGCTCELGVYGVHLADGARAALPLGPAEHLRLRPGLPAARLLEGIRLGADGDAHLLVASGV